MFQAKNCHIFNVEINLYLIVLFYVAIFHDFNLIGSTAHWNISSGNAAHYIKRLDIPDLHLPWVAPIWYLTCQSWSKIFLRVK